VFVFVLLIVAGYLLRHRIVEAWCLHELVSTTDNDAAFALAGNLIRSESPGRRGAAERWFVIMLAEGDRSEQARALGQLRTTCPPRGIGELLALAVEYHECDARGGDTQSLDLSLQAAVLLREIGVRHGEPPIRRLVAIVASTDEASEVRRTAARTLGWIGENALGTIHAAIGEAEVQARAYFVYALAMMRSEEAITTIARVASEDPDEAIRVYAVGQLTVVSRRDPHRAATVRRALEEVAATDDLPVARAATAALAKFGDVGAESE